MKKFFASLVVAITLVGCSSQDSNSGSTANNSATTESTQTMESVDSPESKMDESKTKSGSNKSAEMMKYIDFSQSQMDELLGEKSFVLFFHANWCSWCRAREKDINENLDQFPENTVILKANFDDALDLRRAYDVKTKDSFVFVNADESFEVKAGASVETLMQFFSQGTVAQTEDKTPGFAGYWDYDAEVVETFIGKKPFAFYFSASWCPICTAMDKGIRANMENFPSGVSIFKVDYDTHVDLRKQYEVQGQHTIVFFDNNGEVANTIRGFSLEDINQFFSK